MTDTPAPPSTQAPLPSQTVLAAPGDVVVKNDPVPIAPTVEQVEEEPYTIKCICNFSDDDGNTIYCETCDTWQHIDCFYPDNREEAIREDFAHSCAECKPRPLDRQKAIERTLRLRNANAILATQPESLDKKAKRPPSKGAKRKPKPNDLQINGHPENGNKLGSPPPPSSKKAKSSHRPSHSISSQPSKRSPSYGQNSRANPAHPPSPATTPPDLPNDFQIHHYSAGFYTLYNEQEVPDTHSNAFASLAIPTALSRWLRDPDAMKQEVGRTRAEVFQDEPPNVDQTKPKLKVKDTSRTVEPGTTLRWRCIESTAPIEKDVPLIELNGEIGFQKDYCADPSNFWADLSSPLPFVFFHPSLPLYIDTRKEGSLARYVRRSCKPNAQLDTYLSGGSDYHFWLVSDRYIPAAEQITLPWDFRLEKSVRDRWLHLLGLSDDDTAAQDEPELDSAEYTAISNWIDRMLSEYGGCACDLENNCAFARFHRQYLFGKHQTKAGKKKSRKGRNHTISPTSTGHATNSRAASEGHLDEVVDEVKVEGGSRSKPPSRDRTPVGSFDQLGILTEPTDRDKRKVAMVEDSFRRMEQQQPPRKKKRVSDGTISSVKSKSRNGSAGPPGHYVDAGTTRSKSGSPASARSPSVGFPKIPSKPYQSAPESRQTSTGPRATYCDAAVQTDPVEGHWISESCNPTPVKKRIISLSKRLMASRYRCRITDEERKIGCLAGPPSTVSTMDLDSPTGEHRPSVASNGSDVTSPTSQTTDTNMAEATQGLGLNGTTHTEPGKLRTPDLRVQLPPVPAFDNSGLAASASATPLSAASSTAMSPFGTTSASNPFGIGSINGVTANPSPVKKKLSLSDYKSRLNKAAGKVAGGSALLKPGLSSPEEVKGDISMEPQPLDKTDESTPVVNGV
ncbi:PHD finger and SET domain-containing protein [Pochonia chlamydosporia 170]|uniref:PHD finger and SET domain-containing protein n=1 Tax=Pochonia chlamydosporia 170 TaxID=1380566 RepID=A0A179F3K6_METCM|nr:PHD finger and SET domain-containing protein [Pochonia chlamydosporia 170]OAQ59709.1 PHD finger and SET domain-containing protein [Pochonia chlamydosporia 170]